uniref:Uncharacterized protein n=1 Tax=Arundo donax TaxID=35708 RepID=A0A0A9SZ00_ARUDO
MDFPVAEEGMEELTKWSRNKAPARNKCLLNNGLQECGLRSIAGWRGALALVAS